MRLEIRTPLQHTAMPTKFLKLAKLIRLAKLVPFLIAVACSSLIHAASLYHPANITARDGKFLAADIYSNDTVTPKPVILIQTPYNKDFYRVGIALPQAGGATFPYDSAHYNYVVVDWRGFYGSKAADKPAYDRGLDGYDVCEWIAAQKWCNGKIGTWGASALGVIQYQTAKHHPPHLVCCVPLVKDFVTQYENYFYGGDYRKEHVQSLDSLGFLSTSTITAHPDSDVVWTVAQRNTDYSDSIGVPVLVIGGWYDHFPDDVLRSFDDLRKRGDPAVRSLHKMVMGPWMHTAVGLLQQGALQYPNAVGWSDSLGLRFFERYLQGVQNGYENDPVIRYYQLGENQWHTTDDWNSVGRDSVVWYLHDDTTLQLTPQHVSGNMFFMNIFGDPRNPCPTIGGSRFNPFDKTILLGPQDQRAQVESRNDVMRFTTPIFTNELQIDGPISFVGTLSFMTSDCDVSVRLCDVYPDGTSMLLTQGITRMRFRNGYDHETLMTGDSIFRPVRVNLQNLAITFLAGHRLRIILSASNFPMFDLNLNNGGAMYNAGDTVNSEIRIDVTVTDGDRLIMRSPVPARVEQHSNMPSNVSLSIVPNPIRDEATINITNASSSHTKIEIIDILGRTVATLFKGRLSQSALSVVYHPDALPNGVYWCRVSNGGHFQQQLPEKFR